MTDVVDPQVSDDVADDVAEDSGTPETEAQTAAPVQRAQAAGIPVDRPGAGETLRLPGEPNQRYIIGFDPTEAQIQIEVNDFVLVFERAD